MSIVDKIRMKLQRRRSRSSIFARSVSISTSSCRSSSSSIASSHSHNSQSSGSWDCSDWNGYSSDDGDHDGCCCGCVAAAPDDVPEGYLAVYVGDERRRRVINARHLSHPWFKALLERAAEEFGFDHKEGLRLPCELVAFEQMVEKLDKCEA